MRPCISIVRVAKNDLHNLMHSIPLILKQDISIPYEIIVIDSGSRDGSVEFINKYRKLMIVCHCMKYRPKNFTTLALET